MPDFVTLGQYFRNLGKRRILCVCPLVLLILFLVELFEFEFDNLFIMVQTDTSISITEAKKKEECSALGCQNNTFRNKKEGLISTSK